MPVINFKLRANIFPAFKLSTFCNKVRVKLTHFPAGSLKVKSVQVIVEGPR